ncbi:hypothetical protein [Planomonospora venezuelensis]
MVPYGPRQPVLVGRVGDVPGEGEGAELVRGGLERVGPPAR